MDAASHAYQQTPKWKAYHAKWQREHKDRTKAARDKYRSSEKFRITRRAYQIKISQKAK